MDGGSEDCERKDNQIESQYDWSSTLPSLAIIEAIASIENVKPFALADELDTTLYDHVDPEALNAVVKSNYEVRITFSIDDYRVEIEGDTLSVSWT